MPSFRSRFTASRSYHGNSVAASLLHLWSLKQVEPLTYQICAHQAFACRNRTYNCAPRPPATKTQKSGQPKASHAPQLAPENLPRAASDAWLSDHDRAHAPPWRPSRPPIYETWDSGPHPTIHALSRASRISGIFFTRRWTEHAPDMHQTLLLMSSDVTRWCHHSTPAATQERPRQP